MDTKPSWFIGGLFSFFFFKFKHDVYDSVRTGIGQAGSRQSWAGQNQPHFCVGSTSAALARAGRSSGRLDVLELISQKSELSVLVPKLGEFHPECGITSVQFPWLQSHNWLKLI